MVRIKEGQNKLEEIKIMNKPKIDKKKSKQIKVSDLKPQKDPKAGTPPDPNRWGRG